MVGAPVGRNFQFAPQVCMELSMYIIGLCGDASTVSICFFTRMLSHSESNLELITGSSDHWGIETGPLAIAMGLCLACLTAAAPVLRYMERKGKL